MWSSTFSSSLAIGAATVAPVLAASDNGNSWTDSLQVNAPVGVALIVLANMFFKFFRAELQENRTARENQAQLDRAERERLATNNQAAQFRLADAIDRLAELVEGENSGLEKSDAGDHP